MVRIVPLIFLVLFFSFMDFPPLIVDQTASSVISPNQGYKKSSRNLFLLLFVYQETLAAKTVGYLKSNLSCPIWR